VHLDQVVRCEVHDERGRHVGEVALRLHACVRVVWARDLVIMDPYHSRQSSCSRHGSTGTMSSHRCCAWLLPTLWSPAPWCPCEVRQELQKLLQISTRITMMEQILSSLRKYENF
jgi:hypothetical protein